MWAWEIRDRFGLDALARVECEPPACKPGEVLLRLRAASLNYRDLLMIRGEYNPRQPLPLVPGSDAVGEVIALGEGVTRFALGDRVAPTFLQGWRAGPLPPEALRTTLGGPLPGVLREVFAVPAEAAVLVPSHLSDAEAATLPCAAVTAWRAVIVESGVPAGGTLLTLGTGGVSLFALQLAHLAGMRVIVTSSSDEKLARAQALGAHVGINYRTHPAFGDEVLAATGGRGVDAVVELGGAGTLTESLRAVRAGGTVLLIGVLAGATTSLPLTRIFMRGLRLQGIMVGSRHDFEQLNQALISAPTLRPVVDHRFAFADLPAALAHLASGAHFGKVVVEGP